MLSHSPADIERVHQDGVIAVLYLDITQEQYIAAGEKDMTPVYLVSPELSRMIYQSLIDGESDGRGAYAMKDAAADAIAFFVGVGDRRVQAFLSPAMEALMDVQLAPGKLEERGS